MVEMAWMMLLPNPLFSLGISRQKLPSTKRSRSRRSEMVAASLASASMRARSQGS